MTSKMKFLFAADFHGNKEQAKTIHEAARQTRPDVFVYLGDLSPVRELFPTPAKAGKYVEENIFVEFQKLAVPQKYVIPGNTDFLGNCEAWQARFQDPTFMRFVYNENVEIGGVNCVFLSTVEETDHFLKDYEAISRKGLKYPDRPFIFSCPRASKEVLIYDNVPYNDEFTVFDNFAQVPEPLKTRFSTPVYTQLERLYRPDYQNFIFSHCPAYNTNGDVMKGGKHVGSVDLRDFICEHDVALLCAAHIHESCIYAEFKSVLNYCELLSVGSGGIDYSMMERTYFVLLDTDSGESSRFYITCPKAEFGLDRSY